jgi:opacity protein-like surface antigen
MVQKKYFKCLPLLLFSQVAFASAPLGSFEDVEVSVAVGPNWAHASSTQLVVSPYETDSVIVNKVSHHAAWKVGVGYDLFKNALQQRYFFKDLLVELNFYGSTGTVKGNVWQYALPQFNNYIFKAPWTSRRLMLDVKPSLFMQSHISLYPILGLGSSWNSISYQESISSPGLNPNSRYILDKRTNNSFAYDLGVGARTDITPRLSASLEYIYTHLGHMTPAGTSNTPAVITSPPSFKISNQSLLLGLTAKFN